MNRKIINAILEKASKASVDKVLGLFIENLSRDDYNGNKTNHVLELILECTTVVLEPKNINLKYIEEHLDLLFYNHEKYIVKDLKVEYVDNINGQVAISSKYIEKMNEDADIPYHNSTNYVSYLDNPNILK